VALVAYSFGGLLLKSLMIEAHKLVQERPRNGLDTKQHKCCKTFLNNVKGIIFYGVPHTGYTQRLLNYFSWQHERINPWEKYKTQFGFLKNLESFSLQMEYLSMDFKYVVHDDLKIYAFGEGLPVDGNWVRFSFHHIESYPIKFIS